ncbi:hypothetical protein BSW62_20785 [Salmonella enterica subsp. enterica serovar Enteritidis]|nr:hypothetical protein [Salmonella enterica subsp. enterica serovar Enteritidis]EDN7025689.1 hypothetical protein [Salmonella enterica]
MIEGRMYQLKVLAYLTILWVGSAAADSPFTSAPAPNLNEVLNGFHNDDANTVRMGVLRDLGETIGFRAGMAWEAQNIANALRERETDLDRIFQFGPLMTTDSSLPPVIVEAIDVASVSKDQFRTATKVYNIVKQEEFVAVPPTWRDYLFTGLLQAPDIVYPGEDAKPKNSAEKKAWDEAVKKGWTDGSQQADQIREENFNRLVRDYTGMLRFSALVKQGMISRTQISSKVNSVSPESSKDTLMIGEKNRSIMKKAEFETNPSKWTPVITKSPDVKNNTYQYGGR